MARAAPLAPSRIAVLALLAATAACGGKTARARTPTCATAAAKLAHGMVQIRPDIATAGLDPAPEITQLCLDDAWQPDAIACYAGTDDPRALRTCTDHLAGDQRLHAREVQETLYRRASEVGDGTSHGPTGILSCDDYVTTIALVNACDKLPAHIKQALSASFDTLRTRWQALDDDTDESTRNDVELECASSTLALRQRLDALGCS